MPLLADGDAGVAPRVDGEAGKSVAEAELRVPDATRGGGTGGQRQKGVSAAASSSFGKVVRGSRAQRRVEGEGEAGRERLRRAEALEAHFFSNWIGSKSRIYKP